MCKILVIHQPRKSPATWFVKLLEHAKWQYNNIYFFTTFLLSSVLATSGHGLGKSEESQWGRHGPRSESSGECRSSRQYENHCAFPPRCFGQPCGSATSCAECCCAVNETHSRQRPPRCKNTFWVFKKIVYHSYILGFCINYICIVVCQFHEVSWNTTNLHWIINLNAGKWV